MGQFRAECQVPINLRRGGGEIIDVMGTWTVMVWNFQGLFELGLKEYAKA